MELRINRVRINRARPVFPSPSTYERTASNNANPGERSVMIYADQLLTPKCRWIMVQLEIGANQQLQEQPKGPARGSDTDRMVIKLIRSQG